MGGGIKRTARVVALGAVVSGCYAAHERPAPPTPDAFVPDAGVDAPLLDAFVTPDAGNDAGRDVGPDAFVAPDTGPISCPARASCTPGPEVPVIMLTQAVFGPTGPGDGCARLHLDPPRSLNCHTGTRIRVVRCGNVGRHVEVYPTVSAVADAGVPDVASYRDLPAEVCETCLIVGGPSVVNPVVGQTLAPCYGVEEGATVDYVFIGRDVAYDLTICAIR